MNLSYILNDQGNPIPVFENNISRVLMQNATQTTSNGTVGNIDGCGLIVLQVTGEFVATIKMQVDDSGSSFSSWRNVEAVDTSDGSIVDAITKPGIYEIRNTIGMALRARVNTYTSGAVTVNATVIKTDIDPMAGNEVKKHHELILSARNKSANANGEVWLSYGVDVSKYMFVYAHILTDAQHEHVIFYKYNAPEAYSISGASSVPIHIIDSNEIRDVSEWVELKGGTSIVIAVSNHDTESAHVYDVDIYGVM